MTTMDDEACYTEEGEPVKCGHCGSREVQQKVMAVIGPASHETQAETSDPLKYLPEMLAGVWATVINVVLIAATAWTTVKLFDLSGSWNSLWAMLMLLGKMNYRFKRD